jgi:hypothetical protein
LDNEFLFLTTAPVGRIENSVMKAFFDCIQSISVQTKIEQIELRTLFPDAAVRAAIKRSRIIVVHSPLVRVMPIIAFSHLVGAKVWAFVWDVYPVLIGGQRFDKRVRRRTADIIENLALKICNRVFVPSFDFLGSPNLTNAIVLRLWPRFDCEAIIDRKDYNETDVLKFFFAGQVNSTRGIDEALKQLSAKTNGNFTLMIASHSSLPDDILKHPNVVAVGGCSPSELKGYCAKADFGLVSLTCQFEGPAFPSKTMEYFAHGLPVVYSGPPLRDYLYILKKSETGLDIQDLDVIDHEVAKMLRSDFHKKRNLFIELACINKEDVARVFCIAPAKICIDPVKTRS